MIKQFEGEFRFLSNFYEHHVIEYENHSMILTGKTVEHIYQACKAVFAKDAKKILDAKTPGQAKRLGQKVKMIPYWENAKVKVMRTCIDLKFATNTILAEKLILTEDHFLVEGNHWGDTFWGVCDGRGRNMLGHLLMERRAFLQSNSIVR